MVDCVHDVDELGGDMWLWGVDQVVWWDFVMKNNSEIFYLTCDHFRDKTQPILAFKLVIIDK